MAKEKQKTVANPVGATISRPHFEGMAKKQNGITLIALIITIILMLILVAVSVTVALNGGLFSTAKKGASKTEIAAEKETMVSIVMGAVGEDGQVDFAKLEESLPKEFEKISEGKYKSTKTGVVYIVGPYGTLTYEEPFNAKEWDAKASSEDCFVWASDTPGTEGYGTIVGYTDKVQGNTKLVFPSRCTKIEYPSDYLTSNTYGEARAYVQGIEKIEIPGTVKSIGDFAFYGDTIFKSLKEVNVEYGVTSIGSYAFYYCTSLTNITIPDSVIRIGGDAFTETPWYKTKEDGLIYIGKVAYEYKGEIPSDTTVEIQEGTVSIAYNAFQGHYELTGITIPDSVTSIESYAFSCTGLTSIIIPDNVTSIGNNAFENCRALTKITIPDSVISIGHHAFYNCTALTSIIIPESVTSMGSSAFGETPWYKAKEDGLIYIGKVLYDYKGEMPNNTSIEIIEGTKNIADSAFSSCSGLTNVIIPDSVTNIGEAAFQYCTGLTNITIPNSVTNIGRAAFEYCENLTNVTISENVTEIGESTFRYCRSLENVTIPDSVTSIGATAFYECISLENVTMSKKIKYMGEAAFGKCTSLPSIVIWQNVDELGYRTFDGWGSNQTVNIEAGSTPAGWHTNWNYGCNAKIEYGYTGQ